MTDQSRYQNKVLERKINNEAINEFKNYLNGMGVDKDLSLFDPQADAIRQGLQGSEVVASISEETIRKINEGLLASDGASYFAKDIVSLAAFSMEESEGGGISEESQKIIEELKKQIKVVFDSNLGVKRLGFVESMESFLNYPVVDLSSEQVTATKDSGQTDSNGVLKEKKGYQLAGSPELIDSNFYDSKVSVGTDNIPDAVDNPSLAAFELPGGRFSLPTRNGDAITLFFNAIPTVEMSKCIPYLNVIAVTREGDSINTRKFLSMGEVGESSNPSPVIPEAVQSQLSNNRFIVQPNQNINFSTMDSFLTPQTLSNSKIREELSQEILEPISSFMSIDSFSVTITGLGVGLYSSKRASLKITLHDRSKLNFIAPLISVEEFGKTRFIIDYGWSHPEGETGSNNPIGKFLNSIRDGGVFNLISSNMAIKDNSASITLDLVMSGEQDSFNTLVACGYLVQSNVFRPQIEQAVVNQINQSTIDKTSSLEGLDTKIPEIRTTITQTTSQMSRPDQTITFDQFQEILQSSGANQIANIAAAIDINNELVESIFSDVAFDSDKDTVEKEFSVSPSTQTLLQHMSAKILGLRQGDDPFLLGSANEDAEASALSLISSLTADGLEELKNLTSFSNQFTQESSDSVTGGGGGFREYASLGKVISMFIGYPLATLGRYDEVQLFFYPINDFAAGAHIYTTASFPINITKLQEVVSESIFKNPNLTLTRFFSLIEKNFTSNQFYEVFLLTEELNNLRAASQASVDTLKNQYNKSNDTSLSDSDREKLSEDFSLALAAIGISEGSTLIDKIKKGSDISNEEVNDFKEKKKQAIRDLNESKKEILNAIYQASPKYSGASALINPKFVKPNISLYYESLQGMKPKKDDPTDFENDPSKRVLRIHVYDEESTPHREELTMIDLITKGKLSSGRDLVNVENITVNSAGKINGGDVNMGTITSKDVKDIIKKRIPNVTYGSQFSPITGFNINSNTSGNVNQALLITSMLNGKSPQSGQTNVDPFGEVKIVPTTATMNCLGCPLIQRGGQFYVDLKTNTTADNVYAVQSVSHNIGPGKFTSDVSMTYVAQSSAESLTKKIENALRDYAPEIKANESDSVQVGESLDTVLPRG